MKIHYLLVAACFTACLYVGCNRSSGGSGDAVTLKFNMPKGGKFSYASGIEMNMKQSMMGKDMQVYSKTALAYQFEVTGDSAGWKTLACDITKVAMKINAAGQAMQYDSDSTNADTTGPMGKAAAIFGAIKGLHFGFTMNGNGEVGQVTGMREGMLQILSRMGIEDTLAAESLHKVFSEALFRQNLQQSFAIYPGKPVKVGDSWARVSATNYNGLVMRINNNYTLAQVAGNIASVTVTSTIAPGSPTVREGVQIQMNGVVTGTNSFDLPTGMPVSGNDDMQVAMKISTQGQEIPMKMDLKMSVAGKKL